jgi:hypothetical protein
MGIAADLQQAGSERFGAFKLTGNDGTPKERSRRRARCGRISHELQLLRLCGAYRRTTQLPPISDHARTPPSLVSTAASGDNNCV